MKFSLQFSLQIMSGRQRSGGNSGRYGGGGGYGGRGGYDNYGGGFNGNEMNAFGNSKY